MFIALWRVWTLAMLLLGIGLVAARMLLGWDSPGFTAAVVLALITGIWITRRCISHAKDHVIYKWFWWLR